MAKQWGSYMGGFSGKLGPAVGYQWNGLWVVRSLPGRVRNPRTPRQMEHRDAFRQQVRLAADMRLGVVQGLTAAARQCHMTSYNLFVSLNQPCFGLSDGQLCVDWARLSLSVGPVAPVIFGQATLDEANVLSVSFDPNRGERRAKSMDCVYLYVYCPELGKGYLAAPVYRRDRRISVMLPDEYAGCELQLYGFVQDQEGEGSMTAYIGLLSGGEVAMEPAVMPAGDGATEVEMVDNETAISAAPGVDAVARAGGGG